MFKMSRPFHYNKTILSDQRQLIINYKCMITNLEDFDKQRYFYATARRVCLAFLFFLCVNSYFVRWEILLIKDKYFLVYDSHQLITFEILL